MSGFPERVVCLTAETTEIALRLGAGDRVVGVSAFATRPPEARAKRKVAAFASADVGKVLACTPDLVLAFSDVQKDLVRELVGEGVTVLATNQRTLDETYDAIRFIGRALGLAGNADALVAEMQRGFDAVRAAAAALPRRPRVYFEEWDDPLITGIGWVHDVITAAGGEDVFPELRARKKAAERVVDPDDVVKRDPEVILASWCGKPVDADAIRARPGWDRVTAVREGRIHEVPGDVVLAPGPGLVDGARVVHEVLAAAVTREKPQTPPRR